MDRPRRPRPESATLVAAERGRDGRPATRPLLTSRHDGVAHISIVPHHRRASRRKPVACQRWNMKHDFEYMNYNNSDRLAMLENRAAELERRLGESGPDRGIPDYPAEEFGTTEFPMFDPPSEEMFDPPADEMFDPSPDDRPGYPGAAGYRGSAGYAGASDYGGSNDYGGSAGYGAELFVDSGADRRN